MEKQYRFISRWNMDASRQAVWQAILESERWPEWWTAVKDVAELASGDENGIGSIRQYTMISPMHYQLRFRLLLTERKEFELLAGEVSGDLQGFGAWRLFSAGKKTTAECHWNVCTSVGWMNALSPLLAPVFRLNHALVMKQGAACLAKRLNATIIQG